MTSSIATSRSRQSAVKPRRRQPCTNSRRWRVGDASAAILLTSFASLASQVTKPQMLSSPCSACPMRSQAASLASVLASPTTTISVGPARKSIATSADTIFFAAETNKPPGPTILETLGTL